MKLSLKYRLKKDMPGFAKGQVFCLNKDRYGFIPAENYSNLTLTAEEILDTEWFEPMGKKYELLPVFPDADAFIEYMRFVENSLDMLYLAEARGNLPLLEHLDGSRLRGISDSEELSIKDLFKNDDFQKSLYAFVKEKYDQYYDLSI